jgi:hypothetical protein
MDLLPFMQGEEEDYTDKCAEMCPEAFDFALEGVSITTNTTLIQSIKMVFWILDSRLFCNITLGSGSFLAHGARSATQQHVVGEDVY